MSIKPGRAKAKVFLVDDHALVREHLTALIQAQEDLEVCGEAEDARTAIALINLREPDLVILDISLKQSSGMDVLKALKTQRRKPVVLVLSMHEERLFAQRSLAAGASGYITKTDATTNILSAIRQVLAGQSYVSERIAKQLQPEPSLRDSREAVGPFQSGT